MKVLKCEICGNIVEMIKDNGPKISCCNKIMTELIPNTKDTTNEKHVPIIENNSVNVGKVLHPMTEEHLIEWIAVKKENSIERFDLNKNDKPTINIEERKIKEVYSYCNLHGLWKIEK